MFVLKVLGQKGVLRGKTIVVDATTLEANAAMKSIVRRDTGESWREYIRRLAAEDGVGDPTDDEARRMDWRRPKKRVSNEDWASPSDPQSRITKLKDGRRRQMEKQKEESSTKDSQLHAQLEKYDGAYTACLTGRGYTVK